MSTLRIATRKSPLALWQAEHVARALKALDSSLEVSLVQLTTQGDRFLEAPLAAVGGKGLFIKEIEQALLEGRAEVAVHSLKDVTSEIPPELILGAIPEREDPRDALVGLTVKGLADLRSGMAVGTSSLRRTAQLHARVKGLRCVPLRGNVQTRLKKAQEQRLDATVLALAGLKRLGLADRVTEILEPEALLPAVGQGALAVECRREGWVHDLVARLDHRQTRTAVTAERGFLARLEGGCTVPVAALARREGQRMRLTALIAAPDGARVIRGERLFAEAEAEGAGRALGDQLLSQGGAEILAQVRQSGAPAPGAA